MLLYPLESAFKWQGKRFRLNLSFDAVLRVLEVQRDGIFDDSTKIDLSLWLLVRNRGKYRRLDIRQKAELLAEISANFIEVKSKPVAKNQKTFDFLQDARYIFASFKQAYGIDLQRERGRLDWRKFIALFQGLPSDTKIKEIMDIRGRTPPKQNSHNAEEIQSLMELKAYYALDYTEGEAGELYQRGVDKIASALERFARGNATR